VNGGDRVLAPDAVDAVTASRAAVIRMRALIVRSRARANSGDGAGTGM